MKKGFFSKTILLFLALVMVALMVPMGAIGVFAETADVDVTAETVVIDSVADWEAVAAVTGDTFEGQTVSLGADINFGSESAPVLFDTFSGTFLGNGHTVSGTAMIDQNIIASVVTGGIIDGSDGTENSDKMMTISGFTYNSTGKTTIAMVVGTLNAASAVKNVKVDSCKITSDKSLASFVVSTAVGTDFEGNKALVSNCMVTNCIAKFTHQSGLVVGGVTKYVTIENCSVSTSSITSSAAAVGAILGKMNGGTYADISGCIIASDVTITSTSISDGYGEGCGMVVGLAGYDMDSFKETETKNVYTVVMSSNGVGSKGYLSISGCTVNGTITAGNNLSKKDSDGKDIYTNTSVGGVVGAIGLKEGTEIFGNTVNVTITAPSGKAYVGGIVGSSASKLNIYENTVNATITSSNNATGGVIGYYAGQGANSIIVSRCNISGIVYETANGGGSPRIGGIIGRVVKNTVSASTGANKVEKCDIALDVYSSCQYSKIAGIIGSWGNEAMSATLGISDCNISSVLAVSNSNKPKPAGIAAEIKSAGLTVDGVIVAATMATTTYNSTNKTFGTVNENNTVIALGNLAFSNVSSGISTPQTTNCYTTVKAAKQTGFVVVENADVLANLIKRDSKNFIESVNDYVRCGLVQVSNEVDGKYMVRFIGTSIFNDIESAHMKITATLGAETKVFEADCEAYDVLTAHGTAAQIKRVASESFGAEKFVAITVSDIPAASANDIVFDIELTVIAGGVTYTVTANDMLLPPVAA